MKKENTAPTKRSAAKTIHAALTILNKNGNQMQRKELIEALSKKIQFESWELERYESNGQLKWLTIFLFYSIDCIKAGWLAKDKGTWYLTPEGEAAVKMNPELLLETAGKAYRSWRSANQTKNDLDTSKDELDISNDQVQQATLEEVESQARNSILAYIQKMDAYKFQKVCAALIRAMGYYIEFISPPGRDGGIDIIAFKDPLGIEKPKIKVQVKRYKEGLKIDKDEIKLLKSNLNKGEDIGIFMTSSSFVKPAEEFARQLDIHIKLIDGDKLINLWQEYYHAMHEEEKALLPLQSIYFLGTLEYN